VGQAGVITTTTCTIVANAYGTVATQTNPTSCSVSYDNSNDPAFLNGTIGPASGNADAFISGTFSATSLSFTGHASGFVRGAATALASFDETASLLLDTPGPVRPGFITFTHLDPFPPAPPTGEEARVNVGSYSADCFAGGCSGELAGRPGLASFTLPFTLGEEYQFSESFNGSVGVNAGTSIELGAGGTVDFSYFLTDADSNVIAPFVAVAAVPEPTSVSLCLVGVCLLVLSAKRRNRSSSAPVRAL
jgi:hypothetical protein